MRMWWWLITVFGLLLSCGGDMPTAQAVDYQQTAYFDQPFCTDNQPWLKTPIMLTSYAVPANTCKKKACFAGRNYYQEQTCNKAEDPALDLTTSLRDYVTKEIFLGSNTCSGNATQVIALAADALCHPNLDAQGNHDDSYSRANCNGGNPTWERCRDAKCKKCYEETYFKEPCQAMGQTASMKISCSLVDDRKKKMALKKRSFMAHLGDDEENHGHDAHLSSRYMAVVTAFLLTLLLF